MSARRAKDPAPGEDPGALARARRGLAAPRGIAGSGRERYASAMVLYQAGEIDAGMLEVYRICSPLDGEDPAPLLAALGVPAPVPTGDPPATLGLKTLLAECDGYLADLDGPGIAEVRSGLSQALVSEPAMPPLRTAPHPVVARHLAPALDALGADRPALAAALRTSAGKLAWTSYDAYPAEAIGPAFAAGHAFAGIVGPGCPFGAEDFEFGLFLMAPDLLYRDHRHLAPELYAPLTGPHLWRFGPEAPLVTKAAHEPVWNPPHRPHMTKVGPVPFLCLYAWTRDIDLPAEIVPAPDWAALERSSPPGEPSADRRPDDTRFFYEISAKMWTDGGTKQGTDSRMTPGTPEHRRQDAYQRRGD